VIGKIGVSDLYIAQNEKDQALESYVQALRSFWANYYRLRRVTLYDFMDKTELR
jgi:predicted negative regulator of RcsB-dependent stress response